MVEAPLISNFGRKQNNMRKRDISGCVREQVKVVM